MIAEGERMRRGHQPRRVSGAEAFAAFRQRGVYVERFVRRARHVEVQIAGDAVSEPSHLWERDCTLQCPQAELRSSSSQHR